MNSLCCYPLADYDWFSRFGMIYPGVAVFICIWVFMLGCCLGSFLNVCIWRLPRRESLSKQASHCTVCLHPIAWYDNLPVISYLVLRGKCRHCRTPYSPRYFIVELLCGLLLTLILVKTGLVRQPFFTVINYSAVIFIGLGCAWTDAVHRMIPNALTFSGMVIALITALLFPEISGQCTRWQAAAATLIAGLIPGVIILLFILAGKYLCRCECFGGGDLKLVIALGMLLGLPGALFTLLAASASGTAAGLAFFLHRRDKHSLQVPFAPFLTAGAWIWIFAGGYIFDFYLKLITPGNF